jgi:hypothetical protein
MKDLVARADAAMYLKKTASKKSRNGSGQ